MVAQCEEQSTKMFVHQYLFSFQKELAALAQWLRSSTAEHANPASISSHDTFFAHGSIKQTPCMQDFDLKKSIN